MQEVLQQESPRPEFRQPQPHVDDVPDEERSFTESKRKSKIRQLQLIYGKLLPLHKYDLLHIMRLLKEGAQIGKGFLFSLFCQHI